MDANSHHMNDESNSQLNLNIHKVSPTHSFNDNVNIPNEHGNVPLHVAINQNDLEMLKDLLKHPNIDVNYKTSSGETPLCMSLRRFRSDAFITQLLNAGCDTNLTRRDGQSPLHATMLHSYNDLAHQLIQKGANVNVLDKINRSPLEFAVHKNNLEGVCMLLYYGADVNLSCRYTTALLIFAIYMNRRDIAQILYNFYDDFSYTTSFGSTALHAAARAMSPVAVELVKVGADVNSVTVYGESALFFSLRYEDSKLFQIIWSKIDFEILLNCHEPFLFSYIQRVRFSTPEFLECLYLILNCPKTFNLVEELIKHSSFQELLNSFYYFCVEPSDRKTVINICLSLGFQTNIDDINCAFEFYGFGEELEAFIYSFNNDDEFTSLDLVSPLLGFILGMREFSAIKISDLHNNILKCYIKRKNAFNVFQYFSIPSYQKVHWEKEFLSTPNETFEKLLLTPEFPSLLELSRNKSYTFIHQTYSITMPYQFHDVVKNLKLPPCIQDIVSFKMPIY